MTFPNKWRFSEPPNVAVLANRAIVFGNDWIAYVSHDADDGGWQFHTSERKLPAIEDAAVVSLQHVVEIDASINELADLPEGWHAWRETKNSSWRKEKTA